MREKILKMLDDEHDLEPALIKLMETAKDLMLAAQFGGFTYRGHLENLQKVYDTAESILNEVRKMKKEMEEHDQ